MRNGTELDRRQRKTRAAIYGAFEELMAEEHYSQVTVAQVIDRADIGRSTFYAHFETKDELLEDMCVEMFDHIFEGVNDYCTTHADLETPDLEGKLAHLLYHLRDTHGGVCGKLIREGEPHFTTRFEEHLKELFGSEMPHGPAKPAAKAAAEPPAERTAARAAKGNAKSPATAPRELALEIMVAAFSHTTAWWFRRDAADAPKDVAHWFTNVVMR